MAIATRDASGRSAGFRAPTSRSSVILRSVMPPDIRPRKA
jgi:hypothetical protein